MAKVQHPDICCPVVESANLEHEALLDTDERWMHLSNRDVWQSFPPALVNIKAVAVALADWHNAEAHVQIQRRDASCDYYLIPAGNSCVGKLPSRHFGFFKDEARFTV